MNQTLTDKVLIVIVSRNNYILLQNLLESIEKHNSGYPYEIIVADNSSDDKNQLQYLTKISSKYNIQTFENDRVEITFSQVAKKNINKYKYYLFLHDDSVVHKDFWLKKYIDRANSEYCESQIQDPNIRKLPIGRVGAHHQFWRSYTEMLGMPLNAIFLKEYLESVYAQIPAIFKYVDPERVLYTNECLVMGSDPKSIAPESLGAFIQLKSTFPKGFDRVCGILSRNLPYPDNGISPKDKYPPGKCWNRLTMLSEFLNSVVPLIHGYRSVGLEGDGFVEQLDGFDSPWGQNFVAHFGSPNLKRFLGKVFGVSSEEIHKKIYSKDRSFLIKCNKIIKDFYKNG